MAHYFCPTHCKPHRLRQCRISYGMSGHEPELLGNPVVKTSFAQLNFSLFAYHTQINKIVAIRFFTVISVPCVRVAQQANKTAKI